jgi:4a-hydroxytetrahydrobiopterin dehydratase
MPPIPLSPLKLATLTQTLPLWRLKAEPQAIGRDLVFPDFNSAFGFMSEVAKLADRMDHHPEWFNVYNRVNIVLTTHDVDGLSQNDLDMAHEIDSIALKYSGH